MTVSLYTFVDLYSRALTTVSHLLTKGAAHAATNGVSEAEMLGWRLIDDMQPLSFQVAVVCNFAVQWPARAAGLSIPEDVGSDLDLAGFQAAIAGAKQYLAGLTAEQFDGRDDAPVQYLIGGAMDMTLPAGQWISVFATTNLYFHMSTAYGILRAKGVAIGKPDLFAGGL
ncbi:DUF1993 domain-containing protein [soil metagenome]